tara:strand:- start:137 stop:343 length:207 start_codon:yes stop_codon:yes gene_type:complete
VDEAKVYLKLVNKEVLVVVLVEIIAMAVKEILQPYHLLKVPMVVLDKLVQRPTTHQAAVAVGAEVLKV